MTKDHLLKLVAETAEPIFERTFSPDCCLNATRVLLDVLRGVGFAARPLSVRAFAYNAVYVDRVARGLPPLGDPESWGLGVETRPAMGGGGWPGHLVALVDNRWLVDGSAGQFSRPEKNILVPWIFLGELPKGNRTACYTLEDGSSLQYRTRPYDTSFQKMPGFQQHEQNRLVAEEIMENLKK